MCSDDLDKPTTIPSTIKVASLNCWGLLWSPKRRRRFSFITKYLLEPENYFDFIALQEVWCRTDFERLRDCVAGIYPFNSYFPSGIIGSGLVILSRHPISQSFFKRFSLCGAPDRFWHGDFYSGKGIGGIRANWNGVTVNFYTTHMHAEYGKRGEYVAHRLTQFQEIVQFIEQTSRPSHLAIIGGDFNTLFEDFVYKMMVEAGCANRLDRPLVDAWNYVHCQQTVEACLADSPTMKIDEGFTFALPTNTFYRGKKEGQRIDYIFFVPRPGFDCINAEVVHEDAPYDPYVSFSDHQLIVAEFSLQPDVFGEIPNGDYSVMVPVAEEIASQRVLVEEAIRILAKKRDHVKLWQKFYTIIAVGFLLIFLGITIATAIAIPGNQLTPMVTLVLFGVQPAALVTMFSGVIMARFFLQEERMSLTHFINEWNLWLIHHDQWLPPHA